MKARELLFQMQSRADGGGQLRVYGFEFSYYGCVPKSMDTSLPGILDINKNHQVPSNIKNNSNLVALNNIDSNTPYWLPVVNFLLLIVIPSSKARVSCTGY